MILSSRIVGLQTLIAPMTWSRQQMKKAQSVLWPTMNEATISRWTLLLDVFLMTISRTLLADASSMMTIWKTLLLSEFQTKI